MEKKNICKKYFSRTTSKRAKIDFLQMALKVFLRCLWARGMTTLTPSQHCRVSPPTSCYVKVPVTSAFLHTADSITSSALTTQRNTLSRGSRVTLAEPTEFLSWGETQVTAAERDGAWRRSDSNNSRAKTVKDNRTAGGVWFFFFFFFSMQMCSFIQRCAPCEEN